MKISRSFVLGLFTTLSVVAPAQAENLEQLQQLLSTHQCQRCDLSSSSFVLTNLVGADLRNANLSSANLNQANLSHANLSGANLTGAVLSNANLTGANLSGADLRGTDLREANFAGANLDNALLDNSNSLGALGLPPTIATPEQVYLWGLQEYQRGNFRGAIGYYDRVIAQKPDFAHAIFARSIARFRMQDLDGALRDAHQAEGLYLAQANTQGQQASAQFITAVETTQENIRRGERASAGIGGGSFVNFLGSLTGLLLRFF